jgi:hypothetical protein
VITAILVIVYAGTTTASAATNTMIWRTATTAYTIYACVMMDRTATTAYTFVMMDRTATTAYTFVMMDRTATTAYTFVMMDRDTRLT